MRLGVGFSDKVLPIVPMFHANAWGLPYARADGGCRYGDDGPVPRLEIADRPDRDATARPWPAPVPTIWNDVMHYLESDPGHDISSLRLVACGGSAVPTSMMKTFEEQHGVRILQAWGMTETSPLATMARPLPGVPDDQQWALRSTQGRPVCGVEARIVDDDGNPLPHDGKAVGEVQVRGPWITGSYYRNRDESKFDDGWLHTGDVGRIDPLGYVTLTDRAKDVIKSGGEWISSVELENHLMGHPAVSEAAVVAVPDERWQERPLAVVVVNEGAEVCARELREFLCDKVVRWWLPERWAFIDQVPLHQRRQVRQEDNQGPVRRERLRRHRAARLTLCVRDGRESASSGRPISRSQRKGVSARRAGRPSPRRRRRGRCCAAAPR